jgi:hypothetical protein
MKKRNDLNVFESYVSCSTNKTYAVTSEGCECVSRSESPGAPGPVPAVQRQRGRHGGVPGRVSDGHDQGSVLQRPAHPAEALPAPGRQRELYMHTVMGTNQH